MITGFALGFITAIFIIAFFGGLAQKYAIKKGWFASAVWSEKDGVWKVRGSYLSVASKIHRGILEEYRTGEKKVKYVS